MRISVDSTHSRAINQFCLLCSCILFRARVMFKVLFEFDNYKRLFAILHIQYFVWLSSPVCNFLFEIVIISLSFSESAEKCYPCFDLSMNSSSTECYTRQHVIANTAIPISCSNMYSTWLEVHWIWVDYEWFSWRTVVNTIFVELKVEHHSQ